MSAAAAGPIDAARPVRPGEELDLARLEAWLAREVPDARGRAPLALEQFPSGHSNLTYLLRAGDAEYVLRRPPFGSTVATAHDMGREFRVLSALGGVYPLVPRVLAHCDDPEVIGAPFYVMERVRGVILRKDVPAGLSLGPDTMRRLSERFLDNLVALHAVDQRAAGLGDLGKPEGYVARQVEGWIGRYEGSRTDDIPAVAPVSAWLRDEQPAESGATLIHNDYKYDNLVLDPADPTRILAVLDWEMATVGDPLMDLGTTLGYWIEAGDPPDLKMIRMCLTHLPGNLTRRELVERYAEKTGRAVANPDFYYVFALFKLAVIIQQIYYRYAKGLTRDPRFAQLIGGVWILMKTAAGVVERSRP